MQLPTDFREGVDAALQIGFRMRRRDLHPDTCATLRYLNNTRAHANGMRGCAYHRIAEADDVNLSFQHLLGELTGQPCVAEHHGTDGVIITEDLLDRTCASCRFASLFLPENLISSFPFGNSWHCPALDRANSSPSPLTRWLSSRSRQSL